MRMHTEIPYLHCKTNWT